MSSPIDDLIDWFPRDVQNKVTGMFYTPDDVMIEADHYISKLHDEIDSLKRELDRLRMISCQGG